MMLPGLFGTGNGLRDLEVMPAAGSVGASLLLAESLFKFGSFTFELVAFVISCYTLNAVLSSVIRLARATSASET